MNAPSANDCGTCEYERNDAGQDPCSTCTGDNWHIREADLTANIDSLEHELMEQRLRIDTLRSQVGRLDREIDILKRTHNKRGCNK